MFRYLRKLYPDFLDIYDEHQQKSQLFLHKELFMKNLNCGKIFAKNLFFTCGIMPKCAI